MAKAAAKAAARRAKATAGARAKGGGTKRAAPSSRRAKPKPLAKRAKTKGKGKGKGKSKAKAPAPPPPPAPSRAARGGKGKSKAKAPPPPPPAPSRGGGRGDSGPHFQRSASGANVVAPLSASPSRARAREATRVTAIVAHCRDEGRKLEIKATRFRRYANTDSARGFDQKKALAEVAKNRAWARADKRGFRGPEGETLLHLAADGGSADVCAALLDNHGASLVAIDLAGRTALHYAARKHRVEPVRSCRPSLLFSSSC